MDQNLRQFDEFLRNREGNITKFKLHFQIKYIFSKARLSSFLLVVLISGVAIRARRSAFERGGAETDGVHPGQWESSERAASTLREIQGRSEAEEEQWRKIRESFVSFDNFQNFYDIMNNQMRLEQSSIMRYHQGDELNDSLRQSWLRIRVSEEHLTDRLDNFMRRRKCICLVNIKDLLGSEVNDWAKIFVWCSGILVFLAMLQAFARAQFTDVWMSEYFKARIRR